MFRLHRSDEGDLCEIKFYPIRRDLNKILACDRTVIKFISKNIFDVVENSQNRLLLNQPQG